MGFKHLMLSALILSSSSLVHADGRGDDHERRDRIGFPTQPTFPNDPWGNSGSSFPSQSREIEESVRNYFMGQTRLDLLNDYYIRSQLLGLKIRDITIVASTEAGQGQATLLLNGQMIEAPKIVARQLSSYTFRVDPFSNVVGQSLRSIELGMQGRFYVEKVIFNIAETSGPNGPGPFPQPGRTQNEIVRQQLNERIQQEGGLELFRMFNLGLSRQGQEISKVTVVARSARGFGQASLLVNNQQTSIAQNIGFESTRLTFELNDGMRVGQEIQGLRLYFRGDIVVEEVSLEIERNNGRQGPFPPTGDRRFEQVVNQRLYDTNGVDLRSLMRIPSQLDERIVDSVELVLRNGDMGARLKLCQVIQDRYQSVNCGEATMIRSGAQVVRLTGVNFAKLRETSLSVRMGMVDIDRIAINFR